MDTSSNGDIQKEENSPPVENVVLCIEMMRTAYEEDSTLSSMIVEIVLLSVVLILALFLMYSEIERNEF